MAARRELADCSVVSISRHRLAEVDVDATIVDQTALHLGVRLLGILLAVVLDECVAEAVVRTAIATEVCGRDPSKPTE